MRYSLWLFVPIFALVAGFLAGSRLVQPDAQVVPMLVAIAVTYGLRLAPDLRPILARVHLRRLNRRSFWSHAPVPPAFE